MCTLFAIITTDSLSQPRNIWKVSPQEIQTRSSEGITSFPKLFSFHLLRPDSFPGLLSLDSAALASS